MSPNGFPSTRRLLVIAVTAAMLAGNGFAASRKEQVLYSFQGGTDGFRPIGGVVFDQAGNLYGATVNGGANTCRGPFSCGTVYQLKPPVKQGDPWTETVLYIFKGTDNNDGASPFGGVIFDAGGNLYGTTGYDGTGPCQLFGGQVGCGTVYRLSPPKAPGGSWTETVLYNFQGDKDGQLPYGDLMFDKHGNLYGATLYGGGFGSCNEPFDHHCGTIFKLSPPKQKGGKWTEKVLYSFKNGKDGANPNGGLVFDSKGALYGTASYGGNHDGLCRGGAEFSGCGTVFKLAPPKKSRRWTFQVLHRFHADDGANPAGGVILFRKGSLLGTTLDKGSGGWGTIFKLTKVGRSGSWLQTVLHAFSGGSDGADPMGDLILDAQGNIYGTTMSATSESKRGNVFRIKTQPSEAFGKLDVVYSFAGPPDGQHPDSPLVFDNSGNLYGTTQDGGTGQACQFGCGTVFEVTP